MSQPPDITALALQIEANEIAVWRTIVAGVPAGLAAQLGVGSAEQAGALLIWNRAAPSPLFNRLLGLGVFEPATEAAVDALLARARAEQTNSLVQLSPSARPPELGAQLLARGLVAAPPWLVHSRSLEGELPPATVPAGYRIEAVSPASAPAWGDALLAAWGFSASAAAGALAITLPLAQQPHTRCFAIVHEPSRHIVAGGALFVSGQVAGLYADGVRAQHRNLGLHRALIATRLAEAQRLGCTLVCSQTLEAHSAQHNMVAVGFQKAYIRQNYVIAK